MVSERERRHAPGLDGIRGIAVVAITLYHLRLIDGGILSVSVFFTLSGYLITSILLSAIAKSGTVDLKNFWLRRARRLLPALIVLLTVVLAAAAFTRPNKLAAYGREALSAALYVANWATIARGDNYFQRFTGPGPFDHLWSLAIEEQFYVVWPLFLLLFSRRKANRALVVVTALLAAASATWMAVKYAPLAVNNTRAYEGTDTRAASMLIGALAAMILPLREVGEGGRRRRFALEIVGIVAAVAVVAIVLRTGEYSTFLYRGGEASVSAATAALVLAAAHPQTWIGKLLGLAPFRWLGERSYGIYLWHMPIIAFMPTTAVAAHPYQRAAFLFVLILAVAALSYALLEDPIRKNGVIDTFARGGRLRVTGRWAGAALLLPAATLALVVLPSFSSAEAREIDAMTAELEADQPHETQSKITPAMAPVIKESALTACTQVIHVGDSASIALVSKRYIPLEAERLEGRYLSVGVDDYMEDISGGRAIVEKFNNNTSAYEVVSAHPGYRGCWVFAIGIGDASTIFGNVDALSQRIDWMMSRADGAPVLWATNKTMMKKGPYQNSYMEGWNRAVIEACSRHANMRVYDWASEVQDDWFLPDEVHPNAVGAKERAARFAKALAAAFPKDRMPPPQCVVRTDK
jgi:peptidoglycan/LPS O-acetylase OafA/YrhL